MKVYLWVGSGAVIGALMRFWVQRHLNSSLLSPSGTLLVNILGSAVLGFLVGGFGDRAGTAWYYGMSAGFCGSLTTFSSIALELFEMGRLQEPLRAGAYFLITIALGMGALIGGYMLGTYLRKG